ncbi:hypothetical protein ACM7TS_18565, partial [Enterobacter hormaechei]
YEICALSELKNALRSGDIWVKGSRQFRVRDVPSNRDISFLLHFRDTRNTASHSAFVKILDGT